MPRLDFEVTKDFKTVVTVTLTRRNLEAMLHKLDMQDDNLDLRSSEVWVKGRPNDLVVLVVRAEEGE